MTTLNLNVNNNTVTNKKQELLNGLSNAQKKIVLNYHGPQAVIACPGSGKSFTCIRRCAYMIADGVAPENILMFTFTKKAANELKERLQKLCGADAEAVTVGTYHSFCVKLLKKYANLLGWQHSFTIFDDDDKTITLKKIIKAKAGENSFELREVSRAISSYKEKMVAPNLAIQQAGDDWKDRSIAEIYEAYMAELKKQNAFDFDDLIYFSVKLLQDNPIIKKVVNKQYTYIFSDEVQDSSPRDLALIELLGGKSMNICMVGDDDQSIYSFRGVQISAYYRFIEEHKFSKYMLSRNYRSTQTIVNAAESVIKNNTERLDKDLCTENEEGNKLAYVVCADAESEAEYIGNAIKAVVRKGYEYKDIAILYRMSSLSRGMEKALLKRGIPYTINNGCSFYNREEVKDIMSYLRVLDNPKDIAALTRAVNTPKRGIGDKSVEVIVEACQESNIRDTMDLINALKNIASDRLKPKARKGLLQFAAVIETLLASVDNAIKLENLIDEVVKLIGYVEYLRNKADNQDEFRDRMSNLQELQNIAAGYEYLADFLGAMTEEAPKKENNEEDENNDNKVRMMTMHASKGLEFPVVFIIDASQNIVPHRLSIRDEKVDEERRLFYVAMTRAKEQLFITRAKIMVQSGTPSFCRPSQFIREIAPQYIVRR